MCAFSLTICQFLGAAHSLFLVDRNPKAYALFRFFNHFLSAPIFSLCPFYSALLSLFISSFRPRSNTKRVLDPFSCMHPIHSLVQHSRTKRLALTFVHTHYRRRINTSQRLPHHRHSKLHSNGASTSWWWALVAFAFTLGAWLVPP